MVERPLEIAVGPWARLLLALLCLSLPPGAGHALDFALDLDTGGHRGVIRSLSVSQDGRFLASGSDDKTVRVWEAATGTSLITLRGQIGPGAEGVINAVALSPDGTRVAVGGYFAPHASTGRPFGDTRIFDTQTGQITHVLRGLDLPVEALSYTPERDELVASGQGGIVARWRAPFDPAEAAPLPVLDTEANRVRAVAHALGGARLIVATLDYGLRIWDLEGEALVGADQGLDALDNIPLTALAVSPDGGSFALAGADGRVELRAADDGALLASLPERPFRPDALVLTDRLLVLGCGFSCGSAHRSEVWDLDGLELVATHLDHDAEITAAAPLAASGERPEMVLTAGGRRNEILAWDPVTRETVVTMVGLGVPVSAVGISADGLRVGWGHEDPCPDRNICPDTLAALDWLYDLPADARGFDGSEPRAAAPSEITALLRSTMRTAESAATFETSRRSAFEGDVLRLQGAAGAAEVSRTPRDGYFHASVNLLPRSGAVVTGGANGILTAHRMDGGFLREYVGHTGTVLGLAAAEDVARLVSGSADQTKRIWDLERGTGILTGFVAGEHWIWWTDEGYYHSSPAADDIVGWHINQGRDTAARFVRARQLRRHLHNPAVIRQSLILGDSAQAAQMLMGDRLGLAALLEQPPPEFDLRIAEEIPAPTGQVAIELTGASAEDLADWGIAVLVNDRRVRPVRLLRQDLADRFVYLIALEEGENDIRVQSRDGFDNITERGASRLMSRAPEGPSGRLHVAVIGIDQYPDLPPEACGGRSCDLDFAVADAAAFLATVKDRVAPLHRPGNRLVMLSAGSLERAPRAAEELRALIGDTEILEPTRADILDELEDFFAEAEPDDTTYLFLAGHGGNIADGYFIFPTDARARGAELRRGSLVDWRDLQDQIDAAYGVRMLFIDTCHAAGAVNPRFRKDVADSRVIGFTATLEEDVAIERAALGHGVFTYALIEGLRGRADPDGAGVRLLGLTDYVDAQVRRLSNGKQVPVYHLPATTNFVLTRP